MPGRHFQVATFFLVALLLNGCGKNPASSRDPEPSGQAPWDSLGHGMSGRGGGSYTTVRALVVLNGDLYAGGTFAHAGEIETHNIARWDGVSWSPLGPGLTTNTGAVGVYALQVFRGQLYAGGSFWADNNMSGLARWDGTSWQPVPGWTDGWVFALAVYNGMLAVSANGVGYDRFVTLTDGNGTWRQIAMPDQAAHHLAVWRGDLVATGAFSIVNGDSLTPPVRWDGAQWRSFADGSGTTHSAFQSEAVVYGNDLLLTGLRLPGNSSPVLRWDGNQWSRMNVGLSSSSSSSSVGLLRVCDGKLYIGAQGIYPQYVGYIAVFEEEGRSTLLGRTDRAEADGAYSPIQDVIIYGDQLVVAGGFSQIDGVPLGHIAMRKIK